MPSLKTRAKSSVPISNPNPSNVSSYEKCREERIQENRLRLQSLGILQLKSEIRPVKKPYPKSNPDRNSPPSRPLQLTVSTRRSSRLKEEAPVTRRSSRLKNAAPITYFEDPEDKKGKASSSKEVGLWLGEGERPEIYTEEHVKLLGNTEGIWELGVDGFDKNGVRIYDPVNGKTCHQCRQKTLGYRTQCSQCHPSVTGQFCGDCLYMRYGEHVLEALENPEWICPGCRGICNCSVCRKRKGWLPTGYAYRKIRKLGYKSVAHYLIYTNMQSETSDDEETDDAPSQAFSEEDDLPLAITDGVQDNHIDDNLDDDDDANKNAEENQTSVTDDPALGDVKPVDVNEMDPATTVIVDVDDEYKEKRGTRSKRKMKMSVKPNPNCIDDNLADDDDTNKNAEDSARNSLSVLTSGENQTQTSVLAVGGLKQSDVNEMDLATPVIVDVDAKYEEKRGTRSKRKMPVEPNPGSIGGRLRQRRKCQA